MRVAVSNGRLVSFGKGPVLSWIAILGPGRPRTVMFALVLTAILTGILWLYYRNANKKLNLPPGPCGIPFIGNALAVAGKPFKTYSQWQRDHGDVFMVRFGPIRVLVLGSPELIKEAFQNPNYNGRPAEWSTIILTDGRYGLLTTEGTIWEEQRLFVSKAMKGVALGRKTMETSVIAEVSTILETLRHDCGKPIELKEMFELAGAGVLYRIITGKRFPREDPSRIDLLRRLYTKFGQPTVTAVVKLLAPSLLELLPGLTGMTSTLKVRDEFFDWLNEDIEEHLKTLPADGNPRDYLDAYLLEIKNTTNPKSTFYGEVGRKGLLGTIGEFFFGATETSTLSLLWAMLLILSHDDVKRRVQRDIDEVVGPDVPIVTASYRLKLPFLEAVILEVFRYASITTTGIMHRTIEKSQFHGYDIPANTWIMPNIYAILHDERFWPNPNKFMPERFLDEEGKVLPRPSQSNLVTFSLGKRNCLGESLAKDELFLFMANIFRSFDISFDPSIPRPSLEPKEGFLLCPQDYKVIVTERNSVSVSAECK